MTPTENDGTNHRNLIAESIVIDGPDAYAGWITKDIAARRLHCSVRNIELLIAKGQLKKVERPRDAKRPEVLVSLDQVEERVNAANRIFELPPPQQNAIARADQWVPPLFEQLVGALRPPPAPPTLNLDLDGAAALTGLPKRLLTRAIRGGRLNAHQWRGGYFLHRADLEAFRP